MGIAVNSGSGWKAGGSKSVSTGFSFEWSYSSAQRGYRVQVKYGRYKEIKCGYVISGSAEKMCGNDGKYPAVSGKQMEK